MKVKKEGCSRGWRATINVGEGRVNATPHSLLSSSLSVPSPRMHPSPRVTEQSVSQADLLLHQACQRGVWPLGEHQAEQWLGQHPKHERCEQHDHEGAAREGREKGGQFATQAKPLNSGGTSRGRREGGEEN
jgi:hypothetical protein